MSASERTCGPCTECCRVIGVNDPESALEGFTKAADTQCPNCTSTGCSIYSTRYTVCRTFKCGWLTAAPSNPILLDSDRPDLSGLIITVPGPPAPPRLFDRQVLVAHECFPDATIAPAGAQLIDRLVSNGAIIFGALRGRRGLLVSAASQELANRAWTAMTAIASQYVESEASNQ